MEVKIPETVLLRDVWDAVADLDWKDRELIQWKVSERGVIRQGTMPAADRDPAAPAPVLEAVKGAYIDRRAVAQAHPRATTLPSLGPLALGADGGC